MFTYVTISDAITIKSALQNELSNKEKVTYEITECEASLLKTELSLFVYCKDLLIIAIDSAYATNSGLFLII